MKKIKFMLMFFILTVFLVPSVSAADSEQEKYIAPLTEADSKTQQEIDQHLMKMGFTVFDLPKMSTELKKEIARTGGVKKAGKRLDPTVTFRNALGQAVLVTETNKELINESIRKYDSEATLSSDDFELWGWVVGMGSYNTNQNKYAIFAEYKWNTGPFNAYTDNLAVAWQSFVTPLGEPTGLHYWRPYPNTTHTFTNTKHLQQIEGSSWNVNVIAGRNPQDGFGKQELLVAKSKVGDVGAAVVGYAHRLAPGGVGLSIVYQGITYSSSLQTEYNARFNFTY